MRKCENAKSHEFNTQPVRRAALNTQLYQLKPQGVSPLAKLPLRSTQWQTTLQTTLTR